MNKKEGRARGKKRLHNEAMSGSIYNPDMQLEVKEDDTSSYRNEQEGPAQHDTPQRGPELMPCSLLLLPSMLPLQALLTRICRSIHLHHRVELLVVSPVRTSSEEIVFLADTVLDVCCLFIHDYLVL